VVLRARRGPGDRERARGLLGDALSIADDIGMRGVVRQIRELEGQAAGAA
jgi:hypothetical protein